MPILPTQRDPRLITIRRGGSLTDEHHHLLMIWAIECAERVLPHFAAASDDPRPHEAFDLARGWLRGEVPMKTCHQAAFAANAAGKDLPDAARFAALAAGQAVAVAHVAAHDLGAAAYAIRSAVAAAPASDRDGVRLAERDWQRGRLPDEVRDLVLDDQRARNAICWDVFDD